MGYGSALLFVTAFSMQNGLLGAMFTFSGHPLYSSYRSTTASWGLTPLEDQQIAGLLMWIPGSIIHLATLGFLFRRVAPGSQRGKRSPTPSPFETCGAKDRMSVSITIVIGVSGCGNRPFGKCSAGLGRRRLIENKQGIALVGPTFVAKLANNGGSRSDELCGQIPPT